MFKVFFIYLLPILIFAVGTVASLMNAISNLIESVIKLKRTREKLKKRNKLKEQKKKTTSRFSKNW